MKLFYRSGIIWNQVYFLIISVVYIYVLQSIGESKTIFHFGRFQSYLEAHVFLLLTIALSVFLFINLKKISKWFFGGICCYVTIVSIISMIEHFSKISLFLLSLYCASAYYFFQLLRKELRMAYINSRLAQSSFDDEVRVAIEVSLTAQDGVKDKGILLNWDKSGCFIKTTGDTNAYKRVFIEGAYKGVKFENSGIVGSRNKDGIGVVFDSNETEYSWKHFSYIIEKMGIEPEYIK